MNSTLTKILFALPALFIFSCKKSNNNNNSTSTIPDVYKKIYGASSISSDGTYIIIKTTGTPDHKSVYYPTGNTLYENFSGSTFGGTTFQKNPNSIVTQNYTFKIPLNPSEASVKQATPLALPQSNGINSVGFVFGTIAVGTLAGTSISWRFGLLLTIPATIILYFFSRDKNRDVHDRDVSVRQKGKLSQTYWIACFGFFICICTEFATSFWAAALLRDRVGGTASAATLAIVALGSGMAVGRWYGAIVLKKLKLDQQLITIIILQFIGFAIFWFSHNILISLVSLFINGLGISMQFALCSLRLISFSDKRPDLAIGISSLAAGSGIALAPFILGVLGDHLGISRAYLMVPVLIVIALTIVILIPSKEESHELQN